ncbi:hypothetical protein [uncultured Methanobrevibacter sp.]|uniref:hypothetical protein n=1 Tax=uncultured Methanobrevibacter sp. TaxID=253161 RepID=UPI0026035915|nr:hypothetical protein [uncultured Methanobrevibacter sp.]
MKTCPKCRKKLIKVFHGEPGDELAVESLNNEIIIGNCCDSEYSYYCEYCDEFFKILKFKRKIILMNHQYR